MRTAQIILGIVNSTLLLPLAVSSKWLLSTIKLIKPWKDEPTREPRWPRHLYDAQQTPNVFYNIASDRAECLDVYERKLGQAEKSWTSLLKTLKDAKDELSRLFSALGEKRIVGMVSPKS